MVDGRGTNSIKLCKAIYIEITSRAGCAYGIFSRVVMYQKSSERASELARFLIQTTSVKIPYKHPAHEVIYFYFIHTE